MAWYRIVEVALAITIMINCLSIAFFFFITNRLIDKANRVLCIIILSVCVKMSFALLVNFRHEWGILSHIINSLTRVAYLAFGPLLFLYFRTILKKPTSALLKGLMMLPTLIPFVGQVMEFQTPLWLLQAYLLLFLTIVFFDLKINFQSRNLNPIAESERNWIRTLFASMAAVWLVVNLLFFDRKLYFLELSVVFVVVFYIDIFLAVRFYWIKKGDDKAQQLKYKNSALTFEEGNEIISNLSNLMTVEKLYLDPNLTLPKVASLIDVKPYKLSRVINEKLDMTFNEYVNSFRIEDIKSALKSPENKDLKIACIAFDYGFNSISVFNSAFKKVEKYTPSKFRDEYIMKHVG